MRRLNKCPHYDGVLLWLASGAVSWCIRSQWVFFFVFSFVLALILGHCLWFWLLFLWGGVVGVLVLVGLCFCELFGLLAFGFGWLLVLVVRCV